MSSPKTSLMTFLRDSYVPSHLGIAGATVQQYETTIGLLNRWHGRHVTLGDLSVDLVRRFLHDYAETHAPPTVNSKRSKILALWNFAADEEIIPEPRPRRIPRMKEPKLLPKAWTIDEVSQILDCCRQQKGRVGNIRAADWWTSLTLACFDTGVRITALRQTQTIDYDPGRRSLRIRAEVQKDDAEQLHFLADQTGEWIDQHYTMRRQLIWPWPHCDRWFWVCFRKRIVEPAGVRLPPGGHNLFQRLRRTCVSYLAAIDLGLATRQADHSSEALTKKHYIDPAIAKPQVRAIDLLPRPTVEGPNGNGSKTEATSPRSWTP